jgi:hypothetical protein
MGGVNLSSVVNIASTSDTFTFNDDVKLKFGTGGTASIQWQTDDANANVLAILLPEGGAVDVPVVVIGDTSAEKDLTFFNGEDQPMLAVLDDDASHWIGFWWMTANEASIAASGNIAINPAKDTSNYLKISNTGGTVITLRGLPYLRIGDAATTSHSLDSEDDLMVSGEAEFDGTAYFDGDTYHYGNIIMLADDKDIRMGAAADFRFIYETADADAKCVVLTMDESDDSGNNVPAWVFGEETNVNNSNLNMLDEVVQPHIVVVDNAGKYFSTSSATSDDGGATTEMLATGIGTNAAIGDIVRVTGGTNATAGWYVIDTVDGANEVTLMTNWCTGDVSSGTVACFHDFGMLSSNGICTRVTDGAPDDDDVDIDRDGWIIVDAKNQELYFRAKGAWKKITPDA